MAHAARRDGFEVVGSAAISCSASMTLLSHSVEAVDEHRLAAGRRGERGEVERGPRRCAPWARRERWSVMRSVTWLPRLRRARCDREAVAAPISGFSAWRLLPKHAPPTRRGQATLGVRRSFGRIARLAGTLSSVGRCRRAPPRRRGWSWSPRPRTGRAHPPDGNRPGGLGAPMTWAGRAVETPMTTSAA